MRALFLTSGQEDYLSDGLLCGLRQIFGQDCIDYPKADHMYVGYNPSPHFPLYGRGFTLYSGLLEDIDVDRSKIEIKIKQNFYDFVIFGNIWLQFGLFVQWRPWLDFNKTIILDGHDTAQVYPFAGLWIRRPSLWFIPRVHKKFLYFKREWTPDSHFNLWHRLIPVKARRLLPYKKNLRRISFSIPEQKIVQKVPLKSKDFATHCVDEEIAHLIPGCQSESPFFLEEKYYADLQSSRFAITTKRSGWDCLRHYEICGNACIPCFRELNQKPPNCAPHGLDSSNCISYRSPQDLLQKIEDLNPEREAEIRENAWRWSIENSCRARAKAFIEECLK